MEEKRLNPRENETLIGIKSRSQIPPFLLTFKIFNQNVHNCLVDFGTSSNVMPYLVCKKLNAKPQMSKTKIIQLDRSQVKVFGELKDVLIRLSLNSKVHQTIDIIVVDIFRNTHRVDVGYFLIDPCGIQTYFSCHLESKCINNNVEYEALIQELGKEIDLNVKCIEVFGDTWVVIKQVRNSMFCTSYHLKNYQ